MPIKDLELYFIRSERIVVLENLTISWSTQLLKSEGK